MEATDDDLDINGLVRYRVSDTEHFAIDDGGVVTNIKPLDFEHTKGEYRFYVYAEDQGECAGLVVFIYCLLSVCLELAALEFNNHQ